MGGSINRNRSLAVSGAVVILCLTVIVGMTWALFTDTQTVTNHLQAGDLKISLARVELTKTTLDDAGFLETPDQPDKTRVDFSNPVDKNVFGLEVDANGKVTEKIVPGSTFVAKMEISNKSDVAFGYWIEIQCADAEASKDLAKQLEITVETDGKKTSFVANGLKVGAPDDFVGILGIDSASNTQNFTVTVKFVDKGYKFENGVLSSENDVAQTQNVEFDLVVYAIQVTEAP